MLLNNVIPKHSECHVKRKEIFSTLSSIWVVDSHKLLGSIVNPTEIKVDSFKRQASFHFKLSDEMSRKNGKI